MRVPIIMVLFSMTPLKLEVVHRHGCDLLARMAAGDDGADGVDPFHEFAAKQPFAAVNGCILFVPFRCAIGRGFCRLCCA